MINGHARTSRTVTAFGVADGLTNSGLLTKLSADGIQCGTAVGRVRFHGNRAQLREPVAGARNEPCDPTRARNEPRNPARRRCGGERNGAPPFRASTSVSVSVSAAAPARGDQR